MVPEPHCVNRIKGKIILKDTTEERIEAYVKENSSEWYYVPPGFTIKGTTIILKKPLPLGFKVKRKKLLIPFVKPCFGPVLVETDASDEDFEMLRESLGGREG
jgi:hypothetical protein